MKSIKVCNFNLSEKKMQRIAAIVLAHEIEEKYDRHQGIITPEQLDQFDILIEKLEAAECDPIMVITGGDPYFICEKVKRDSFYCYQSPEPELGEIGALRFALQKFPDDVFGFIIAFIEDERIKMDTLRSIRAMAQKFPDKIVVPQFHGHYGRPIYFSRKFFESLLQTTESPQLFFSLENYLTDIKFLSVNDEAVLDDEIFLENDSPVN